VSVCRACCPCQCLTVQPHPRSGKAWDWNFAYFRPGQRVVVQECFDPRRPAVVVELKPGRRYPRVNYLVKFHDGTSGNVLLEDLVGWWSLSDSYRVKQGPLGQDRLVLPRGHTWPGVGKTPMIPRTRARA